MRFLVDVCIGAATENLLKQNLSHDLVFVRDINAKMKDDEIVKVANLEERIIITADKDFGELVYQKQMKNYGILLLRTHDLPYQEKAKLIVTIINTYGNQLLNKFSVYQSGLLRIRS